MSKKEKSTNPIIDYNRNTICCHMKVYSTPKANKPSDVIGIHNTIMDIHKLLKYPSMSYVYP